MIANVMLAFCIVVLSVSALGKDGPRLKKVLTNGEVYLMIKHYTPPKGACIAEIYSNNSAYGPAFTQKMYPDQSEQFIVIDSWKQMRENPTGYLIHIKDVDDNILATWQIFIAEGQYKAKHIIPAPEPDNMKQLREPNVKNI